MDTMLVGNYSYCDFQKIQQAIDYIEQNNSQVKEWITVYILEGKYEEQVSIKKSNIKLIGIGEVIISHAAHARQKDEKGCDIGTFKTATLFLDGENVHLENLIIENTAGQGEKVGQAVALYANCDKSTFRYCQIKVCQDTLLTSPLPGKQKDGSAFRVNRPIHKEYRQFYHRCVIEGTVDFIFGGATAYFDQCLIKSKTRGSKDKFGYITAACTPEDQHHGYVFHDCFIISEENTGSVYLGRPWRAHAKVRFQQSIMDNSIHRERWHDWHNKSNRQTATFEEYGTTQLNGSIYPGNDWSIYKQKGETLSPHAVFQDDFYKFQ